MRALIASLLLLTAAPVPAIAKTYSADRFDSRIRALPDGTLEVVETVVFRFEDGPFTYVFRELPTRKTDGIDIVSAEMDGRALTFGKEPGQVEIQRRSSVHVRWHFAPSQGTTHTFTLRYKARGVVQRVDGGDLLEWRALPAEHDYRIDSSEVVIEHPAALQREPRLQSRRVAEADVERDARRVRITASGIGKNGWLEPSLHFDEGSVIAAPPAWQARKLRAAALAPRWATAAGVVFVAGLLLMIALRRHYENPPSETWSAPHAGTPPDTLRPAIAGTLSTNGSVTLQHAMATLFALADRGDVTIVEGRRKWGRQYTLNRMPTHHRRSSEEETLLTLAFSTKGHDETAVPLSKARSRVAGKLRDFKSAVYQELRTLGLLDEDRMRVRSRYQGFSVALLILAVLLVIPSFFLVLDFGGWPFLIAGAAAALAIVGFLFWGALTPFSNEGVRRAQQWRAYRRYLKDVARERMPLTAETPTRLLPYAVALDLAAAWSRFIKQHPTGVPPWYRALATTGANDGFPAFIAHGGAGTGSGGGGGAAGGGGSGAG